MNDVNLYEPALDIRTPAQLSAVIRSIQAQVAAGELVQTADSSSLIPSVDVCALSDEGAWPDYIEARFAAQVSGARFTLVVETFHGVGGSWRRSRA
jgi:hypothetical protein